MDYGDFYFFNKKSSGFWVICYKITKIEPVFCYKFMFLRKKWVHKHIILKIVWEKVMKVEINY